MEHSWEEARRQNRYVFVSHAGPDKKTIAETGLLQYLAGKGIHLAIDRSVRLNFPASSSSCVHDFEVGDAWNEKITDWAEQAGCVLVFWSRQMEETLKSGFDKAKYLERELTIGVKHRTIRIYSIESGYRPSKFTELLRDYASEKQYGDISMLNEQQRPRRRAVTARPFGSLYM